MIGKLTYEEREQFLAECECGKKVEFSTNSFAKAENILKQFGWEVKDSGFYKAPYVKCSDCASWISVEDRLPTVDPRYGEIEVLVHMDDGFIATTTFVKDECFELWAESGEVTHWQPLPQPPKRTVSELETVRKENKGCKHCQNADKIWAVDSDGVMEVEKGGEHCFPYIAVENDTFGTADLFSINYCPMCGNKLSINYEYVRNKKWD